MLHFILSTRSRCFTLHDTAAILALCCGMCVTLNGCGSGRPDPLAVVKDGADEAEDESRPVRQFNRLSEDEEDDEDAVAGRGPNGAARGNAQQSSGGAAPFDLKYLPTDTELVIYAEVNDIIQSPLVKTLTGGRPAALDWLVSDFGLQIADLRTVKIGIRDLAQVPTPSAGSLFRQFGSLSLFDLAAHPDVSATVVFQAKARIEERQLEDVGDVVRAGQKRYFRLRSNSFRAPCAYLTNLSTLIVANESTIQVIIQAEASRRSTSPTETFEFARQADFVVAAAPQSRDELKRWLPALPDFDTPEEADNKLRAAAGGDGETAVAPLDGHPPAENAGSGSDVDTASPSDGEIPVDAGAQPVEAQGPGQTPDPAVVPAEVVSPEPATDPLIAAREAVTGAAFMLNFTEGVAVSVSLESDTPEDASALESELKTWAADLQSALAERADSLPGGLRELVESLRVDRIQSVTALTTGISADRQIDAAATLPGYLFGTAESVTEVGPAVAQREPPGALAERVLLEGIPPQPSDERPAGLELRALARWEPARSAADGPRQLELAVVAFGGPATSAVAVGHLQLDTAEVNRLTPLKWLGTSLFDDMYGLNPIDTYVPVEHGEPLSVHPKNGVLATFTVVPPSESAASLRRFQGSIALRYFNVTDDVIIPDVRQALASGLDRSELARAGVEIDLGEDSGRETVEIFHDETGNVGAVELIQPDGTPVPEVAVAKTTSQGKVLRTLTVGEGPLPAGVGLRISLQSELAQITLPFEFTNLPIPDVGGLSEAQRARLVWSEAESDSGRPEGLVVEAQARWDSPDAPAGHLAGQRFEPAGRKRVARYVPSDDDDDDDRVRRSRSGRKSERPLRIVVDFMGPVAEESDALGSANMTSIETDFNSELNFEGAYFQDEDATSDYVRVGHSSPLASAGPPGGLRVEFLFTPPLEPIHQLTRFNGSIKLHISHNRVDTVIGNLQQRDGKRLTDRALSRLGLAIITRIEADTIRVALMDGDDDQIAEMIAVDTYGDPIPGVTAAIEEGKGRAKGQQVHSLTFDNGIPAGVGLRIRAHSGVREVNVPFRFVNLPIPPAPGLPGL